MTGGIHLYGGQLMSQRPTAKLPASLSRALRQFEHWRSRHRRRARLPEELWAKAVKLARAHGVSKTAKVLGLDYYGLKDRLEGVSQPKVAKAAGDFVEVLAPGISSSWLECTIDLEKSDDLKIRLHIKGIAVPDLAALSSALWRDPT
jgi:hypothetical protein